MITSPKNTSYHTNFLLVKIGSNKAVKNAPVLNMASVTDTFEALIAPKKVTQCKAITKPASRNDHLRFRESEPIPLHWNGTFIITM